MTEKVLYNTQFYELISEHKHICICETEKDLRETLSYLSAPWLSNIYRIGV